MCVNVLESHLDTFSCLSNHLHFVKLVKASVFTFFHSSSLQKDESRIPSPSSRPEHLAGWAGPKKG
jgi:hypothetical protein